jgi:hypothetical protein
MPGWYVHMEAAHEVGRRLRNGEIPAGFAISETEAKVIGEMCHTWRNYLAPGAIGPDLFYLLPDYTGTGGMVVRDVVKWALDVWEAIDSAFLAKWEKWIGPVATDRTQLASQLQGGLGPQLAQVLDEASSAVTAAFEGVLARMADWFGFLTSGVPQGYGDDAFFWSDVFHYQCTCQFPYAMFRQAMASVLAAADEDARPDAQAQVAFAVGWTSHCATDVARHPFTNAKCSGPYRDRWQSHHLVENHFDAQNYGAKNAGSLHREYGSSALHFRLAFRTRTDTPYDGRDDAPAYDYWNGSPAYDDSGTPTGAQARHAFFDLDTGPLPAHLVKAIQDVMAGVHPDGPKILAKQPAFSATDAAGRPDGRPNEAALAEMWQLVYRYLKLTASDGVGVRAPTPPSVITDHSFPTPPAGNWGVDDDPTRGADMDDSSFDVIDLLLAIFAWPVYLAEVIVWLATVVPGLITDVATFPAREVVYWSVVVPAWTLYLHARQALVMTGFLMPMQSEIDLGLTMLGTDSGPFSLAAALDSPLADTSRPFTVNEPSGRAASMSATGMDGAYPRGIVRDRPAGIAAVGRAAALHLARPLHYADEVVVTEADRFYPSQWLAPWRYPLTNAAGTGVAQEGPGTQVGPYLVGDDSRVLLGSLAGDRDARTTLEKCGSPQATAQALDFLLRKDKHLGGPIDYSLYLIGRMAASRGDEFSVPDFNLDSDRGYAWHCWDWDRHAIAGNPAGARDTWECVPGFAAPNTREFSYAQPCTPPQFFHADSDNPDPFQLGKGVPESQWYDQTRDLLTHYRPEPARRRPGPRDDECRPSLPHPSETDPNWRDRLPDEAGR